MLYINIIEDKELQEAIEKVASGLIPHKNYDSEYYMSVLQEIIRYIRFEEFSGEYYVLFSVFNQIRKIGLIDKEYKYKVAREIVNMSVQANILDVVKTDEVRIEEILLDEGYETNISIEKNLNAACMLLHKRTMELYDRLFELATPSNEALSYMLALRSSLIRHIGEAAINIQAEILSGRKRLGRKVYSGSEDWIQFSRELISNLDTRLNAEVNTGMILDSIDKGVELLDKLHELYQPLCNYGLPPLDDKTPILRHRLVVVCANENVGKTKFAINSATNLLIAGKRIVYMCGETSEEKVYAMILSNYIFKLYGLYITADMIAKKIELPEDKQKIVNISNAKLAGEGLVHFISTFRYKGLYDSLVDIYHTTPFDGLFIDHSLALEGEGTENERVADLARDTRRFKRNYPVYVQVLSHLSTLAKEMVSKGKEVDSAPTRGNGMLSNEADELLVLMTNKTLEKEQLIAIQNYKRRDAGKVEDLMILQKRFSVAAFIWDERLQAKANGQDLNAKQAMEQIISEYDDDEGDDEYGDI